MTLVFLLTAVAAALSACQLLDQVTPADIVPGGRSAPEESDEPAAGQSLMDRSPRIRQAGDIPATWTPAPAVRSETPVAPEAAATVQAGSQATYTVQSGDTLAGIAIRFNVTLEALAAANGIEDFDYIEAGQVLVIPQ